MSAALKLSAKAILLDQNTPQEAEAFIAKTRSMVLHDFLRTKQENKAVNPYALKHLTLFPTIAGAMRSLVTDWPEVLAYVLADPDILVTFLTMNYSDYAEAYEERLLGNGMGQYVCDLLEWSKATGTPLRRPVGYYQQFLIRDPYWAIQANRIFPNERMMKAVAECAVLERKQSASAALYYLLSREEEAIDDYLPLFTGDMQYSYLGLRLLFGRGFSANGIDVTKLNPRWAYHFLCFGTRIPEQACLDVLLKSPEWTVEYLVDEQIWLKRPETVRAMYPACVRAAHPHPAIKLLHNWYNRIKQPDSAASSSSTS
jgi:hypothetical protein